MLLMIFFIASISFAQGPELCQNSLSFEEFKSVVESVRKQYFPEIDKNRVEIQSLKSSAYFLQARPKFKHITRKEKNRGYLLQVNPKLLKCSPPSEAVEAILIHEFYHIKDYSHCNGWGVAKLGVKYQFSISFRARYERATDMKVLQVGHGEGLALYREWLYPRLTRKDLNIKKRLYLTPEKIRSSELF